MSQIEYRANLSASDIPLLSAFQGQTVIVSKFDQNYDLDDNPNQPTKLQRERQIADAYYCHNVVPTGQGFQSIGYTQKIPAAIPAVVDFDRAYLLRDVDENKSFFSPSGGKNYIFDRNRNGWQSTNPITGHENALVTIAYLNGETYIFYEKLGCFRYDKVTGTMVAVVLVGIVSTLINGICSSSGFLLAWDDNNTIYRSQSASPLDFTPDSSLGSGSGIPEDIRGKIVTILPIANGFIIYTSANAVGATFQQNIRYPFIFKEIEGSAGVISPDHISWQDNLGEHYVWSKVGLLRVNKSKAVPAYPKITDFLTAKIFEDFNPVTNTFTVTKLDTQLRMRPTTIGSRYVILSYGQANAAQFSHAILLDLAFKRFGKLKIDHVDCFSYAVPNISGDITWDMLGELSWDDLGDTSWAELGTQIITAETPREIVGFMANDGSMKIVDFDLARVSGDEGVLILGKYQFSRSNLLGIDELLVESIDQSDDFQLTLLTSIDGKNITFTTNPYLKNSTGVLREYQTSQVGKNHSLVLKNTFHITDLQMVFHVHGRA